ncbi:hypothetical protein FB451DRAFT_1188526 [Mycena latifolia]|nr:hypothetical protein FB451DRAFT_1188526 [Mycena latifolia]
MSILPTTTSTNGEPPVLPQRALGAGGMLAEYHGPRLGRRLYDVCAGPAPCPRQRSQQGRCGGCTQRGRPATSQTCWRTSSWDEDDVESASKQPDEDKRGTLQPWWTKMEDPRRRQAAGENVEGLKVRSRFAVWRWEENKAQTANERQKLPVDACREDSAKSSWTRAERSKARSAPTPSRVRGRNGCQGGAGRGWMGRMSCWEEDDTERAGATFSARRQSFRRLLLEAKQASTPSAAPSRRGNLDHEKQRRERAVQERVAARPAGGARGGRSRSTCQSDSYAGLYWEEEDVEQGGSVGLPHRHRVKGHDAQLSTPPQMDTGQRDDVRWESTNDRGRPQIAPPIRQGRPSLSVEEGRKEMEGRRHLEDGNPLDFLESASFCGYSGSCLHARRLTPPLGPALYLGSRKTATTLRQARLQDSETFLPTVNSSDALHSLIHSIALGVGVDFPPKSWGFSARSSATLQDPANLPRSLVLRPRLYMGQCTSTHRQYVLALAHRCSAVLDCLSSQVATPGDIRRLQIADTPNTKHRLMRPVTAAPIWNGKLRGNSHYLVRPVTLAPNSTTCRGILAPTASELPFARARAQPRDATGIVGVLLHCIAVVALAVLARAPSASRRKSSPHSCAISAQDPSGHLGDRDFDAHKLAFAQVQRDVLQIHARASEDSLLHVECASRSNQSSRDPRPIWNSRPRNLEVAPAINLFSCFLTSQNHRQPVRNSPVSAQRGAPRSSARASTNPRCLRKCKRRLFSNILGNLFFYLTPAALGLNFLPEMGSSRTQNTRLLCTCSPLSLARPRGSPTTLNIPSLARGFTTYNSATDRLGKETWAQYIHPNPVSISAYDCILLAAGDSASPIMLDCAVSTPSPRSKAQNGDSARVVVEDIQGLAGNSRLWKTLRGLTPAIAALFDHSSSLHPEATSPQMRRQPARHKPVSEQHRTPNRSSARALTTTPRRLRQVNLFHYPAPTVLTLNFLQTGSSPTKHSVRTSKYTGYSERSDSIGSLLVTNCSPPSLTILLSISCEPEAWTVADAKPRASCFLEELP